VKRDPKAKPSTKLPLPLPNGTAGLVADILSENGTPDVIRDAIKRILEWWESGTGDMAPCVNGFMLVGHNPETRQVHVTFDRDRVGHVELTQHQALELARLLTARALAIKTAGGTRQHG
jgi:hypothetical protein